MYFSAPPTLHANWGSRHDVKKSRSLSRATGRSAEKISVAQVVSSSISRLSMKKPSKSGGYGILLSGETHDATFKSEGGAPLADTLGVAPESPPCPVRPS